MNTAVHLHRAASPAVVRSLGASFGWCSRSFASAASSAAAAQVAEDDPLVGSAARPISDYSAYISERSAARMPSAIRELQPLLALDGMISLGGGMPNPDTFPFKKITVEVRDGSSLTIDGAALESSLQYSNTPGLPRLLEHLSALQIAEHGDVQPDGTKISVTTGSQDALAKAFDALLQPGDTLMCEAPTYSGSLAYLQPLGCGLQGVACDAHGMVPADLRRQLEEWDESKGKRPQVIYTIPTGSNPTGASLSLPRKREIYQIAREYDMIILEDDPYYFLSFPDDVAMGEDGDDGRTHSLPTSLLSMDVDGRVLRFDSLSKLLSSGIRIGFVTGPPQLVQRIDLHSQATTLHTSGVSQALVLALFDRWQETHATSHAGFVEHVATVSDFYRARRDHFLACADRHLSGLAEWTVPTAGMFVWFKINGVDDTDAMVKSGAKDLKVLLVPGTSFMPVPGTKSGYVRAAFSTASESEMDEALRRFSLMIEGTRGGRS